MMRTGLQALLSHWWRHPFQLATLILGLALATALWSGVQAINAEARASYDAAAATLGETRYTQLLPAAGETVDEAVFARLRQAGWLVSPVIEGRIEAGGRAVRLVGIDALSAPPDVAPGAAGGPGGEEGGGAALLQFITPPGQLVVNPATAPALRDAVAAELVLSDDIPPGTALGDVGIVQTLLGAERRLSRFILLPDQPRARPPLAEIAPELSVRLPEDGSDVARLTDSFHLNLTAFGLLSFAVGLFIVHGAIGLAFEQRRPVFRTLRALGLPLGRLILLLLAELAILAVAAALLGMVLGYLVAAALLPDVAATLRGLYGAEVSGDLNLRPGWWAAGLAIALAGTAAAAAGALWRVARLPLLAPARPRAWARGSARMLWLQGAGALLLGLSRLAPGSSARASWRPS
jgi:putative ABC transport system permease protein